MLPNHQQCSHKLLREVQMMGRNAIIASLTEFLLFSGLQIGARAVLIQIQFQRFSITEVQYGVSRILIYSLYIYHWSMYTIAYKQDKKEGKSLNYSPQLQPKSKQPPKLLFGSFHPSNYTFQFKLPPNTIRLFYYAQTEF